MKNIWFVYFVNVDTVTYRVLALIFPER